jgi:hypothetical protein
MKTKTSINFTKTALLELKNLPKGKIRVYETKEKGLSLYVTFNGHKSFFYKETDTWTTKRYNYWSFSRNDNISSKERSQKIKLEIITGQDPTEKRKKQPLKRHLEKHFRCLWSVMLE